MKIIGVTNTTIANRTGGADLYTIAKASFVPGFNTTPGTPVAADLGYYYVSVYANGQGVFNLSTPVAGTTISELAVSPSFYPVSTKGAECGAIVNNLAWADRNLYEGYEFIVLIGAGAPRYFVNGVCNFTTNEAYNPFTQTEVVAVACWDASHEVGVQPFG